MMANAGWTVVATWANPDPKRSGHMATVMLTEQKYNANTGPMVSNVGEYSGAGSAKKYFGQKAFPEVRYYYDSGQVF
jgi:hypothetical protein